MSLYPKPATKPYLRLIGDIHHGPEDFASEFLIEYVKLAQEAEYSLQVGDLSGGEFEGIDALDPEKHRFIGGNHDNYSLELTNLDKVPPGPYTYVGVGNHGFAEALHPHHESIFYNYSPGVYKFKVMPPHYLGNYGIWQVGRHKIFYFRGAWSIDGQFRRLRGWDWYAREQCSMTECSEAIKLYEQEKPDFVVTHTAPGFVLSYLHLPISGGEVFHNQTERVLSLMHEAHQPKRWVFGHFHQSWSRTMFGTEFICLNMFPRPGLILDLDENLQIIGSY